MYIFGLMVLSGATVVTTFASLALAVRRPGCPFPPAETNDHSSTKIILLDVPAPVVFVHFSHLESLLPDVHSDDRRTGSCKPVAVQNCSVAAGCVTLKSQDI